MRIATSPDGQWAAVRRGREVSLLANGIGPATGQIELPSDDADLLIVGPPSVLAVVTRGVADGERVDRMVLYQPPYLEAVARLDLDAPMRVAAVTGPRVVLVSLDGKAVTIVRIAARGLSSQALDPGSPVEFAVGLERNQVLFGLLRKLEAWDAVSGRPLLRMQLPLPPAPRVVGPAHGHLWAMQPGSETLLVCRLSDGRPFDHAIGAPIDEVICHPASPLLVLVTPRGLVRLHCFAHAVTLIEAPWRPEMPLAQLVVGDDIALLGLDERDDELWRVPIGGAGAPPFVLEPPVDASEPAPSVESVPAMTIGATRPIETPIRPAEPTRGTPPAPLEVAAEPAHVVAPHAAPPAAKPVPVLTLGAGRADGAGSVPHAFVAGPAPHDGPRCSVDGPRGSLHGPVSQASVVDTAPDDAPPWSPVWREPLARFAAAASTGDAVPAIADDSELGVLVQRLALSPPARRALVVLYGRYLIGKPAVSIARLAELTGDWVEPLGQGELHALALLRRRGGRVGLRTAVTDLLDGLAPRAVRLIGAGERGGPAPPGLMRLPRDGRSDAAVEVVLAERIGRLAIVEGEAPRGVLEAFLRGATAVALTPPEALPAPLPRGASMIVVADPLPPLWVEGLPAAW